MPPAPLASPPNIITKIPEERPVQRVIVFGAGLSKGFGLPIATELLPETLAHAKSIGIGVNLVEDFVGDFYPAGNADVEDLLGMADAARHYGTIRASTLRGNRWRPTRVDELEYQLRRCISAYFWSRQSSPLNARLTPLVDFVKRLGPETAFVTFNYDLLLETALTAASIPFSYHLPMPVNGVVVLKPHGSINWFDRPPPKIVGLVQKVGVGDCVMHVTTELTDALSKRGVPAGYIVAPSPTKRIESEYLRRVWTGFSSVISNSKALAVVGYSLPTADRLARLVIHRANSSLSNTRFISVINPAPLQDHFIQFVDPRLRYYQQRFHDYAQDLKPHLKELRLPR